jgi:hypothetical protein
MEATAMETTSKTTPMETATASVETSSTKASAGRYDGRRKQANRGDCEHGYNRFTQHVLYSLGEIAPGNITPFEAELFSALTKRGGLGLDRNDPERLFTKTQQVITERWVSAPNIRFESETSTAPTSVALVCRWRSRPQHQKQTFPSRHGNTIEVSPNQFVKMLPSPRADRYRRAGREAR